MTATKEQPVLSNRFDIRDSGKLSEIEAAITFAKAAELEHFPIEGTFDYEHYKAIKTLAFPDCWTRPKREACARLNSARCKEISACPSLHHLSHRRIWRQALINANRFMTDVRVFRPEQNYIFTGGCGPPQLFSEPQRVYIRYPAAPLQVGRGAGFLAVEIFKELRTPGDFQRHP